MATIVGLGLAVAPILFGASPLAVLGGVAVVIAIGAAAFRLALGLAVLVFAYPFDMTTWLGPLKLTTSAALMGILVVVWLVAGATGERPFWVRTALDRPVLFFAAATALSLFGLGGYMQDQLIGLAKAAGGFLVFCVATQSLEDRHDVWLVMGAVAATGTVQAVGLTLSVLHGTQTISEDTRVTGTVSDANLFAGYLVLIIPVAIAAGLAVRSRWTAFTTGLAILAFCVALIATLSRSGWLGMMVSCVLLTLLLPGRRRELTAIGVAIAVVLIVGGVGGPIADRLGPHVDGPVEMLVSRLNVWSSAIQIAAHHPLFGVGVANFQNYYLEFDPGDPGLNHAHNLLLNTVAERGILGLAAFLYLLVQVLQGLRLAAVRSQAPSDKLLVAGLIAAFGGYLAHSMLEVSYYDYKVLILFWLLVGVSATVLRLASTVRA